MIEALMFNIVTKNVRKTDSITCE